MVELISFPHPQRDTGTTDLRAPFPVPPIGRRLELSAEIMPDMDSALRLNLMTKFARALLTSEGRYQPLPGIAFDCSRLEIVSENLEDQCRK